jgi:hypothetical protein
VRLFTPDVEVVLTLFRHAYEMTSNGFGAMWFRRIALPASGGIEDQPAKVMQQLAWVESLENAILAEQAREKRQADESDDDE